MLSLASSALFPGLVRLAAAAEVPDEVQDGVQGTSDAAAEALGVTGGALFTAAIAFVLGWVGVWLAFQAVRLLMLRRAELRRQMAPLSLPLSLAGASLAARLALGVTARAETWYRGAAFVLMVVLVAALAWAAWRIVDLVEKRILWRYREVGVNDRRERRIRTQTMLIRRILSVVIVVIAIAAVLISIPEVRSLGAGLLASAGLISVIAGLAVQSTLTNVFAGVQLAFTDSIRVGDVVTMDGVFGTVEEITLSNVVVKIWDGRRMVYPSSHFTTEPFENWTRVGSAVAGVVELDVDWRVPMEDLRARLAALLESTELWDGKENAMQVTDAVGGMVRIRAVVSAKNSGELWDLRCLVREDLVAFLRQEHPEGILTQRHAEGQSAPQLAAHEPAAPQDAAPGAAHGSAPAPASPGRGREPAAQTTRIPAVRPTTAPLTRVDEHSALYTGSITAVQRNAEMAGPGEDAFAERRAQRDAQREADGGDQAGAHAARPDQRTLVPDEAGGSSEKA
ncbi:mechanosensitive ion channel domain-containing protein [Micrococcus sp. NPDC055215]